MRTKIVFAYVLLSTVAVQSTVSAQKKHALLIGVSEYPELRDAIGSPDYELRIQLRGPENDVRLFAGLLKERFDFSDDAITVLSGWDPSNEASRPTRENIVAAFEQMIAKVGPGDQVVILMGGHGTQQPAAASSSEIDGLDEVFLPADAAGWASGEDTVKNGIVDDEIGRWLRDIRAKGAFVWILFDSCHSGTMTRGGPETEVRYRYLDPEILQIPSSAATATSGASTKDLRSEAPIGVDDDEGIVATYAAQAFEKEKELRMPPGASREEQQYHGLLTYAVVRVLTKAQSPLTYRELSERIFATYHELQYREPTPFSEGELDTEVLGLKEWPGRSVITLVKEEQALSLTQGALLGLNPGTILAVYPPSGEPNPDQIQGHVLVTNALATIADVEPVAHANIAAPDVGALREGARCEVVYRDFGNLQIGLAVQTLDASSGRVITHAPDQLPEDWTPRFESLDEIGGLIRLTNNLAEANWLFRIEGNVGRLLPIDGALADADTPTGTRTELAQGPYQLDEADRFSAEVSRVLRKVYKWENLKRLGGVFDSDPAAPEIDLGVRRCTGPRGRSDCSPLKPGALVEDGDSLEVTLRPEEPVDVTLLFLSSKYDVLCRKSRRLQPRDEPYVFDRARISSDESSGLEYWMAIAVRPPDNEAAPVTEFCFLEQRGLERTRGSESGSPLHDLMQEAAFGGGRTRGLSSDYDPAIRLFPIETLAGEEPPPESP